MQVSLDNKDAKAIHTNYSSRVGWNEVLSIFQYQEEFDRYNWDLLCNDLIVTISIFRFYWSSPSGFNIEFFREDSGYSYSQIESDIRQEQ